MTRDEFMRIEVGDRVLSGGDYATVIKVTDHQTGFWPLLYNERTAEIRYDRSGLKGYISSTSKYSFVNLVKVN